ncbi:hypothetical protein [Kitasatospora sp. GP82]|uniref:hypothetical protein n=1 Tax=Kitasatospora sp. GP82 TaxID=3035089 RepID=UPI00247437FC|nr:hypothetical protein [Kitasatospora sp. GP82]MDH6123194.1 hypothetical protein [Kitasatospora sp. GP82]
MSTSTAVPLTSLPGVRGWLRRLHDDLRAGRSCLWLLPRALTSGPGCVADALLTELLHEIGDFLLLPTAAPDRPGASVPATPAPPPTAPQWSGLAPLLDYDDGLSGFGAGPGVGVPSAPRPVPARPITPAESLAELLGRLAAELAEQPLAAQPGAPSHRATRATTEGVLARLVGEPDDRPETRPVIIRAWNEEAPTAATNLLRRIVATAKEAGLPPDRRPRALVVVTAEDLPANLPDQLAREDIAVHWWWGAVGRLDTATVVAVSRPPRTGLARHQQLLEAVVQATITEVSGPFLDVAAALASHWNGSPETLLDALRLTVADTAVEDTAPPKWHERVGGPGHRPDQVVLTPWSAGIVDNWDGHLRRHPAHDLAHRHIVATRVWLAQHHALLPRLDDAREEFTDVVRRRARIPLSRLAEQYGPRPVGGSADPDTATDTGLVLTAMELGAMWGAHLNGHIALNEVERRRLRTLWRSRNRLAHRTPLDEAQLHQLVSVLSD